MQTLSEYIQEAVSHGRHKTLSIPDMDCTSEDLIKWLDSLGFERTQYIPGPSGRSRLDKNKRVRIYSVVRRNAYGNNEPEAIEAFFTDRYSRMYIVLFYTGNTRTIRLMDVTSKPPFDQSTDWDEITRFIQDNA